MADYMTIVVFKNTGVNTYIPITRYGNSPPESVFIVQAINSHGGVASDYLAYQTTDSTIHSRVSNGDEFVGTISNGVVTGLDFTPEDSKGWVRVSTDIDRINLADDGSVSAPVNVTVDILDSAKNLDTNYNGVVTLCALTPKSVMVCIDVTIISGTKTFPFTPKSHGPYSFPSDSFRTMDKSLRIESRQTVTVVKAV